MLTTRKRPNGGESYLLTIVLDKKDKVVEQVLIIKFVLQL